MIIFNSYVSHYQRVALKSWSKPWMTADDPHEIRPVQGLQGSAGRSRDLLEGP